MKFKAKNNNYLLKSILTTHQILCLVIIVVIGLFACNQSTSTPDSDENLKDLSKDIIGNDSITQDVGRLLEIKAAVDNVGPKEFLRKPYRTQIGLDTLWSDLYYVYDKAYAEDNLIAIELIYSFIPYLDGELATMFMCDRRLYELFDRNISYVLKSSLNDSIFLQSTCEILSCSLEGDSDIVMFKNKYLQGAFYDSLTIHEKQVIQKYSDCLLTTEERW